MVSPVEHPGMKAARYIRRHGIELAERFTREHFARHPELEARYGSHGRTKCLEDAAYHLRYLAEALAVLEPSLFANYITWAGAMLAARGIPAGDLRENLAMIAAVLEHELDEPDATVAADYIRQATRRLSDAPEPRSPLDGRPHEELARTYLDALLRGDRAEAARHVVAAVDRGVPLRDVYLHVFQACQHEIGRLWQLNRLSVAQEHFCTAATQLIMARFYPMIFQGERNGRRFLGASVGHELHELGIRMVSDFFEMDGWESFYVGANTPIDSLVQIVTQRRPHVVGLSTTLTTHLGTLAEAIEALRGVEAARGVPILVGGYPFNVAPGLAERIGADGSCTDASEAVATAQRLLKA